MDWGNLARDEIILPVAITFMLFMFVLAIYYAYAAIKWLVFLVFPTFEAQVEATKETLKGRVEGMKATDKDEAIAASTGASTDHRYVHFTARLLDALPPLCVAETALCAAYRPDTGRRTLRS